MDLIEWSLVDIFYSTKANYDKKDVLIIINNFIQKLIIIKNIKDFWTNDDIINLIYDIFLYHDKRLSIYNCKYIKNIENHNEYYKSYNKDRQSFQILKKLQMYMVDITDLINHFPYENLVFKWCIQYKNDNTNDNDNFFVKLYTFYNNRIENAIKIQNDIKERIVQIRGFAMIIMWLNKDHCSLICNAKYIKKQQYQDINPCIRCQSMELEMLFSDISNICTSYHCKKCQHHHKEINCPFNRTCSICKKIGHYGQNCRYKNKIK